MIFRHTAKEPGLWRGWLKNGQSVEVSTNKYGWDFGGGVHIHSNDEDLGNRMLFLKFWRLTVILPLGITQHPWPAFDGPQWSVYASSEFGLTFRWGLRSKSFEWPFRVIMLDWEYESETGWRDMRKSWASERHPKTETHPYRYTLRSGKVQKRNATIHRLRRVMSRHILHRLGWPKETKYEIDVEFNGEVGERTGSWKGGTIGCGYDMRPGETPLQTLRRMEREREFN